MADMKQKRQTAALERIADALEFFMKKEDGYQPAPPPPDTGDGSDASAPVAAAPVAEAHAPAPVADAPAADASTSNG